MITKITNHVAAALDNLVEQFKGKPKLSALLTAFVVQVQEIEDALFQLLTDRGLDTAIGAQLDGIGSIIGEARQGRADELYRLALRKRIGINTSDGTPESILHILFLFDGDSYEMTEYAPATFEARKLSALTGDPELYLELLQGIKAAGVRVAFQYALVDNGDVFSFAAGDDEDIDERTGFADDAETIGGFFSDVVS